MMHLVEKFSKLKLTTTSFAIILVTILFLWLIQYLPIQQFYLGEFVTISIFAILAVSWDLLSGLTGYLNFGIAFSFGMGGYVTALFATQFSLPPAIVIVLGGLGSVFFGLLIGVPSLRVRGHFFILVTLLVPLATSALMYYLLVQDGSIFHVNDFVNHFASLYDATVLVFALTAIVSYFIAHSHMGLIFRSIRENETAAEAAGVHTGRYKILAFCMSGFFAGLAGSIYVYENTVATPTDFGILFSALPVFMAAIGGMGTIVGPIIGAFLLQGADFVSIPEAARLLVAAILLIIVLMFYRGGIWGELRSRLKID